MGCIESFRNQNAAGKAKIIGIAVGVVLLITVITIVILLLSVPKEHVEPGGPDRIQCPGFYNQRDCTAHGCAYEAVERGPNCYMKKDSFGYKVLETSPDGKKVQLQSRTDHTPYGPSISKVVFETTYLTENIVRVKLYDAQEERYEVPVQKEFPLLKNRPTVNTQNLAYEVLVTNKDLFQFQVKRKDGEVLWDTSIGGLVLSDQYLQVASYLPSDNIYGLGEHTHKTLRHDLEYRRWPMFSRDRFPGGGEVNLYGVHPFYTCLENSTKSHGVFLLNSNAMEVTLLPKPAISFRTIGGILDLFFFVGDNPEHVVQLYSSLIGRPMMPPYWGLGFQLSRWGYNSLENVKKVVERTRKANITQDVQILDIDHMYERRDFTIDDKNFSGLVEYIKKTQDEYDLKWIIILDPAIEAVKGYSPYETGKEKDVFIKRSADMKPDMFPPEVQNDTILYGKVWPEGVVAFPDFLNKNAQDWWNKTVTEYHSTLPFDGLWIDMNEPSNFATNEKKPEYCPQNDTECWSLKCPRSAYDDPPYNPLERMDNDRLSAKTICMDSVQSDGTKTYSHYDVHSLYGWSQIPPTLHAAESATGTRSLVISRSTYPSSGRHSGHWLGDNTSLWEHLRYSIIGMLEFNLFGIPYIGADICGFFGNATGELCTRWMQLGAFYPFFRNHNGMGQKDQDPAAYETKVMEASRRAVERRYRLQPYLYTLFYRAHVDGSTVIRPMFHEFPQNSVTWDMKEQFMWGKCMMVSPFLYEGQTTVKTYLPGGEDWWLFKFDLSYLEEVKTEYVVNPEVLGKIPVHVRGGCIIPSEPYRLKGGKNATKEIELYVFLKDKDASGELFIDDGLSKDTIEKKTYSLYQFTVKNCTFEMKTTGKGTYSGEHPTLTLVHVAFVDFDLPSHPIVRLDKKVYKKLNEFGDTKLNACIAE